MGAGFAKREMEGGLRRSAVLQPAPVPLSSYANLILRGELKARGPFLARP
jgi:hypothetical protein